MSTKQAPTKLSILRWQLDQLAQGAPPEMIYDKPGSGTKTYLAQYYVILRLNQIFGPHKWDANLIRNEQVGRAYEYQGKNGRVHAIAYECDLELVVTFADGTIKRSSGSGGDTGTASNGDFGSMAAKARKGAYTDALKRAAMLLGPTFGCSLYDKGNPVRNAASKAPDKPPRNAEPIDHWHNYQNAAPLWVSSPEADADAFRDVRPPTSRPAEPESQAPPQGFTPAPAPQQPAAPPQAQHPPATNPHYPPPQQQAAPAPQQQIGPSQAPAAPPAQPPPYQAPQHAAHQWNLAPQGPSDWQCQQCGVTHRHVFGPPDLAGSSQGNSCSNCGTIGSLHMVGPSISQQQGPPVDPAAMHAPPVGSAPINGRHTPERVEQARRDMDVAARHTSPGFEHLIAAVDSAPILHEGWTMDMVNACLYQHGVDLNSNNVPGPDLTRQLIAILAQPPAGQVRA